MDSIKFLAVDALLFSLVFASPFHNAQGAKKRFEHHVKRDTALKTSPEATNELLRVYAKYGFTPPANLTYKTITKRSQSGIVVAIPEINDRAYNSPVQIGTPYQTLNLDFDTGSSDLWVFSQLQPHSETAGHNVFNSAASSTYQTQQSQGGASHTAMAAMRTVWLAPILSRLGSCFPEPSCRGSTTLLLIAHSRNALGWTDGNGMAKP
jgi:hypothetical protein